MLDRCGFSPSDSIFRQTKQFKDTAHESGGMMLGYCVYRGGAAPRGDDGHAYLLDGQGHGVRPHVHAVLGANHHPVPGSEALRDERSGILVRVTVPVLPGQKERFRVAAGAASLLDCEYLPPVYALELEFLRFRGLPLSDVFARHNR
jgi:hypothetical protein